MADRFEFIDQAEANRLMKEAVDLSDEFQQKTIHLLRGLLFDDGLETWFNAGRRWAKRLSERERSVVVMKLRGMSFYTIADRLTLHPSTVKTYWKRAIEKKPIV